MKRGWIEITHPKAATVGHREFQNTRTGEKLAFDKGKLGLPGFEGKDHYHRFNQYSVNSQQFYLDALGNPVPKGSKRSHIIPGDHP